MATITQKPQVTLELHFKIDEAEALALDALVGYGDDAFIKAFKEKLGAALYRATRGWAEAFFPDNTRFRAGVFG